MKKVLLAALLLYAGAATAQSLRAVAYTQGQQQFNGLITANAGQKRPGVLILPAWKGIDEEAKTAALALEQEGYTAFIADIYGAGHIPADNTAAAKIAGRFKADYQLYQDRIGLALSELKKSGIDTTRIAVIGYCFGGTGALEAARAGFPIKAALSIHGGLGKDSTRPNGKLPLKILIENPAEDKSVTAAILDRLIRELNEGKADWQLITYAQAKHTFTDPHSADYHELMAKRAWQHTLLFLKEVLH